MIAEGNLADLCMTHDLPGAEEHAKAPLALARRWGLRGEEAWAASNIMYILTMAGRLDEAARLGNELLQSGGDDRPGARDIKIRLAGLEALRGNVETAREPARRPAVPGRQRRRAEPGRLRRRPKPPCALGEGSSPAALESARRAVDEIVSGGLGVAARGGPPRHSRSPSRLPIELGDLDEADRLAELLTSRPRGEVPPFLRAQLTRARALVAGARGDDEEVEENLVGAEGAFRELGYPYWTARAQLDRAEWLARQGRLEESARARRRGRGQLRARSAWRRCSLARRAARCEPDAGASAP